MNRKEKIAVFCLIMAALFYSIGLYGLATLLQKLQTGSITDAFVVLGLVTLSYTIFSLSIYFSFHHLRSRLKKEIYWTIILIFVISSLFYVSANYMLHLDIPNEWIVTLATIIATPLACVFAGYPSKEVTKKIGQVGLDQALTIFVLVVLVSLPIVQYGFVSFQKSIPTTGTIVIPMNLVLQNTFNEDVNSSVKNDNFFQAFIELKSSPVTSPNIVNAYYNWG